MTLTPEERADLKAILDLSDADMIVIERRIQAALHEERERCAKIAEDRANQISAEHGKTIPCECAGELDQLAAAIRSTDTRGDFPHSDRRTFGMSQGGERMTYAYSLREVEGYQEQIEELQKVLAAEQERCIRIVKQHMTGEMGDIIAAAIRTQ